MENTAFTIVAVVFAMLLLGSSLIMRLMKRTDR